MTTPHVVVTGAGTGIGRAIALRQAREGAAVGLVGLRQDELEATAAAIDAPSVTSRVRGTMRSSSHSRGFRALA